MITVSNLHYNYSSGTSIRFPDFRVKAAEHFLLLGESGSGKTTLLHLIGGLLRGYQGSVNVDGTELSSLSESSLDHFRAQKVGFIFQRNHLITALTVEKNLALSPYLAGSPIDTTRISNVLSQLDLSTKANNRVTELSQGQAQRVAIARAIINKPTVLIADEPTSALDDKNCDRVISLLLDTANQNKSTLIVATHDQRVKDKIKNQIQLA